MAVELIVGQCFRSVMNPGDPILLEAPLYAGVLPYLQSINAEMIGKSNILSRASNRHGLISQRSTWIAWACLPRG